MINGQPWPSIGARQMLTRIAEHPLWKNRSEHRPRPDRGDGLRRRHREGAHHHRRHRLRADHRAERGQQDHLHRRRGRPRGSQGSSRIRIGAGGIMLPNHAPLQVAEQFGTLESLFPGRIDLGLGRAPGTDR
ncbi:MAG TPA: LLM class flavin-dependent oxidoreductase, partial [Gemmatimonadales bacterium]|nr:LLM class flavin-dependent oxidoreductase [Gemmatimonadales bacterium]